MLNWLKDVFRGSAEVVEAHVQLAGTHARQAGLVLVGLVALGVVSGAAICGLLASAVVVMSEEMGLAGALMTVSASAALVVGAGLYAAFRGTEKKIRELEEKATAARRHMDELVKVEAKGRAGGGEEREVGIATWLKDAARNPAVMAAGTFAALGVLGLKRTMQLVRAAGLLASAGAMAVRVSSAMGSKNGQMKREDRDVRARREHTGRGI